MSYGIEIYIDNSELKKWAKRTTVKLSDLKDYLDYELRTAMFDSEKDAKQLSPVGKLPRKYDPLPHGKLRRSIHVEPRGEFSYSLVANVRNIRGHGYAKYVDQGTIKMKERPFMTPAIKDNIGKFIEKIRPIVRAVFTEGAT